MIYCLINLTPARLIRRLVPQKLEHEGCKNQKSTNQTSFQFTLFLILYVLQRPNQQGNLKKSDGFIID